MMHDGMAGRLAAIRRGKRAGTGEPFGVGESSGGVGRGEARPGQRHRANSVPVGAGSGGMHPSEGAPGTGSSSSSSGGAAAFDGGGESTAPDIWSSPGRRSVSVGGEPPSGGVLRTGSSRGKWGSPDRRGGSGGSEHPSGGAGWKESYGCEHPSSGVQSGGGKRSSGVALRTGSSRGKWGSPDRWGGCGASEHPSGGEDKQESSTLDDGEVVSAAVMASQERSSPGLAGKDSEAAETPALEVGGTTAYRYHCALGCGGTLEFPARPVKLASGIWPRRRCSQCAEHLRIGQCECLGCGQPLSSCKCTGVAPRRITSFFNTHGAGA